MTASPVFDPRWRASREALLWLRRQHHRTRHCSGEPEFCECGSRVNECAALMVLDQEPTIPRWLPAQVVPERPPSLPREPSHAH